MKRILMFIIGMCLSSQIYALPLGNPADASLLCQGILDDVFCCGGVMPCDWLSLRIGYYGDFVFNRHIELHKRLEGDLEEFQLTTNAGYLAFNFCDRIDIFATLGATQIEIETNIGTFAGFSNGRVSTRFDTGFSYSVGARGTLLSYCCTSLGAEFQYFYSRNLEKVLTLQESMSSYPNDVYLRYREWQIGLGIAHRIACLIPYIGLKWSHVQVIVPDESGPTDYFTNAKDWGYAVGATLNVCGKASLTAEARLADEKALYVNGQLRF